MVYVDLDGCGSPKAGCFAFDGAAEVSTKQRNSGIRSADYFVSLKENYLMKRNATAVWHGSGKEGNGHLTSQSNTLDQTQYSYLSRFESGIGTNPEELMAAAHAGCFTMKLSFVLGEAGFTPDTIETRCDITLDNGVITTSALTVKAKVPGITEEKFQECAQDAKVNCPVSKAYSMEITLDATLG
jgi:osmotically inducible protein OsmC